MSEKPKPIVGQVLYSLNIGNACRNGEQSLTPVMVSSVGRKYFKTKRDGLWRETEFYLDDWREHSKYSPSHQLFSSPQEWLDEKERTELLRLFREAFNCGGSSNDLSLKQLRSIKAIFDSKP